MVEGHHDTATLQQYFDCDTIETGGNRISEQTMRRIEEAARKRGIIIFTDPDSPGEYIRRAVKQRVPEAKHVFIEKKKARTDKKVGVEHARKEDLEEALSHVVTFEEGKKSLDWNQFIDLGLVGNAPFRHKVCQAFHIGPCNAKTCFKRLNAMGVTEEEIREAI